MAKIKANKQAKCEYKFAQIDCGDLLLSVVESKRRNKKRSHRLFWRALTSYFFGLFIYLSIP